jgi:putative ABC transport system permease protein
LYSSEPQPKQDLAIFGIYAESAFLSTFTFPLVAGDAKTVLDDPKAIILTETTAKRIFGDVDVIGREVMTDNGTLEVRGIMKDFPANTHLSFQAIASYKVISKRNENRSVEDAWTDNINSYVYIHADDHFDREKFQQYLDRTSKEMYSNRFKDSVSFSIQPLSDITPGPEMVNSPGAEWSYQSFAIAGGLALLILLPACFNYTNISIARALKRSREIGLRKTLGGVRRQIFIQFISETIIVTSLSLIGSLVVFVLIRNEFQSILVAASALDLSLTLERFLYFLLFAIFTGFVAGFLPAMHFSRLNPIDAIRNNMSTKFLSGVRLRKVLIVFQFTLCLAFILGLVIFSKQYRYALNYDLGFSDENILDVELKNVDPEVLRNELSKIPAVQNVSMSSGIIGHGVPSTWGRLSGSKDSIEVYEMYVDEQFISNVDIDLVGGKTFDKMSGKNSVIINEVMMKRLNFAGPSEALGQVFEIDTLSLRIVGVIKTFHFWQLYAPPGNFFFRYNPDKFRIANVKIASNDVQATLEEMESVWKRLAPGQPFTAHFLSDETAGAFDQYKVLLKMFGFMGFIAVSISCLGLLGMVVYTAESRTKEVGIRKVMGATRMSLAVLLSRDFLKLMLIASLFAIPITLLFDKALSGMAYYRVDVTPLDMLLGMLTLFALGVGTMASQTWRAASINPAETLKHE